MKREWFSLGGVSDEVKREESDSPKPNCRKTNILYGCVGYRAFTIRKEDHHRRSKQKQSSIKVAIEVRLTRIRASLCSNFVPSLPYLL
jgi:hypothetical protein